MIDCARCGTGHLISHYDEMRCYACGYTQDKPRARKPKPNAVLIATNDLLSKQRKVVAMLAIGINEYVVAEMLGISVTEVKRIYTRDRYSAVRKLRATGMTKADIARTLDVSRGTVDRALTD